MFNIKIKPFLVAKCLFSTYPMGGRWMKKIHFMNQAIIGRFPSYVTCRTLMELLIARKEEQRRPILESLVSERIVVLEDWESKPTSIEVLFYDHGMLLSRPSGTLSDSTIFKAECDACFYDDKKLAKLRVWKSLPVGNKGQTSPMQSTVMNGTASVASVIWKNGKLFECQAIRGIRCVGMQHAEGTALLSVLKRGRQHGISILDVVTDCEENRDIMMGKHSPHSSEHPETCMAFIQASKKYTVCKCRWEPREMISHVNDVARAAFSTEGWILKQILEEKSSHFWGMPFVRVNQNRNKTIDALGVAKVKRKKIKCANTDYISVLRDEQKADVFEYLVDGLVPKFMIVLVTSDESAFKVTYKLGPQYSCTVLDRISQIGQIGGCSNAPCNAYILVGQTVVPPFSSEKTLVVVYDRLSNPIQYNSSQDTKGVIPVHIVGPQETIPPSAREVDPFLYGFFNYPGTRGIVLKEKPDGSDNKDGNSDESSDESSDEVC